MEILRLVAEGLTNKEIGTRADPELEARATAILEQISPPLAA